MTMLEKEILYREISEEILEPNYETESYDFETEFNFSEEEI